MELDKYNQNFDFSTLKEVKILSSVNNLTKQVQRNTHKTMDVHNTFLTYDINKKTNISVSLKKIKMWWVYAGASQVLF